MRETALRRYITIISIASVVLAGLILLIMKLRFFDTVNTQLTQANTAYGTAANSAKELEPTLQAQKIAENNLVFAREQVNSFRARFRSLTFDIDPASGQGAKEATWRRYLNEFYTDYGVEMRRVLIQAADESGVVLSTSVKVQTPPQNPEDVVSPPGGFLKPLADGSMTVTVAGTLPNILRFFDRINQSEVLMSTGNVSSPGVKLENSALGARASFTLTPFLVASGPSALLPAGGAAVAPVASSSSSSGLGSPSSSSSTGNSSSG